MNHVPLFYYPTTWICVDDDPILIESLCNALKPLNNIKSFQCPLNCVDFLNQYQSFLDQQIFLTANTEDEYYGTLAYSGVDFNVKDIVKLSECKEKHQEITSMVMDYKMPEMNGLELAKKCRDLSIPKILLTAEVRPNETIDGFNDALIHRFIQKTDLIFFQKLLDHLKRLTYQYFQSKSLPLLAHLEADKPTALSDPKFSDFFSYYCEKYHVTEFYLIDKQGSFLCIDAHGERFCLVIHTQSSLEEWTSLYQENAEIQTQLEPIKQYKKIPFFGVGVDAWDMHTREWPNHYYSPQIFEGKQRYWWAHVAV